MKLFLRLARHLHFLDHPEGNWVLYPSAAQARVQARYEAKARTVIASLSDWMGVPINPESLT